MKRTFYAFSAFIVISFILLGGVLNYLAHNYIHREAELRVERDLEILMAISQASLIRKDYDRIKKEMSLWSEKDPNIMSIRVMRNNNIVIAAFSNDIKSTHFLDLKREIPISDDQNYTFEFLYDLTKSKRKAVIFSVIFLSISACVAFIFIIALWFILKRMAILPLQREITRRKQIESDLRDNEEKYRSMMEALQDPVYICSPDFRVEYMNPAMVKRVGQNAIGEFCFKAMHGFDEKCPWCRPEKISNGAYIQQEITSPLDGRIYNLSIAPITHADGSKSKMIVFRDVTRHNKMMTTLKEYSDIINNSPVVAFRWKNDEGWPVQFASENVKELTGYASDDLTSGKIYFASVLHPDDRERVIKEVSDFGNDPLRTYFTHEPYRIITKDGKEKWIDDRTFVRRDKDGNIVHYEGLVIDITEQKKFEIEKASLESQLHQAQKMEAIGTLAGGIAHDFNNILSAIIGFTEISLDEIQIETQLHDNIREVLNAGMRAKDLVQQILTFSRQSETDQKPVVVGTIIEETLKLLRSSLPSTIEIHQDLTSKKPVMADPTQIHQIIMNLCTNAGHAMEKDGGILRISLTEADLNADFTDQYSRLEPGSYLKLCVSDTGSGIAPQIIDRIFEPYFTTKPAGKGTGLGLSVIQGIVQSCKGAIIVESIPGSGTTFDVYLPVIQSGGVEKDADKSFSLPNGTEHILFVDDEQFIISLGKRMLESLGYTVKAMSSSVGAQVLFEANPNQFDLVITDMTMPNMTGDILAGKLMAIRPEIPVILCTGYSEKISPEKAESIGIKAYLMKPVSRGDFAKTIRKALDGQ